MNVCIDAQASLDQRAGVARYLRCLVEALSRLPGDERYVPFYFDFRNRESPFSGRVERPHANRWIPGRVIQTLWRTGGAPPYEWFAPQADVYHFPNYTVPPLRRGTRCVLTVHDAAFHRYPDTLDPANLAFLRKHVARSLDRADAIVAVSRFAADEFRELYPACRDRIHGIPLGLSDGWEAAPDAEISQVRTRHGLERPYVLTVGTLEPRKNHALLLDAWEALSPRDMDLIVVGRAGWRCDGLVARLGRLRDRGVRWIPHVDDGELRALYTGAELFAFPSRYEGFGFPPLEAMRCGTAVLASPHGSLEEILGDGARLIPEDDTDAWASALEHALDDTAWRRTQAEQGHAHSRGYSWERTARRTRDIYLQVSGRTPGPEAGPALRR